MNSTVDRTGRESAWARFFLGLLCAGGWLAGEAGAQGPLPTYEKKASWAATLVALRAQTARQPQLFRPPPAFGRARPSRTQQAPPHPLVALWAQLEGDFPLECDWLLQDLAACGYPCSHPARADQYPIRWFGPRTDAELERTLLLHVIEELGMRGEQARSDLEALGQARTPPHSEAWLNLYATACRTRRDVRLRALAAKCSAFVFTKHFNMGGSHYTFTEGLSDAQSERHFVAGSSLCLLEIAEGTPTVRTLLEDSSGVLRDPDVSYAGDRVLFAWKKSDRLDDYHLHELDLASGNVRQLTYGLGFADYEGVYLPDGDLLFNSTRCVQVVDCFFTEVSNLYTCDRDGRFLRRLAFDQVHSNYPTVTEDGRLLYTRWEYNDRGQIFTQALFQMNPDGTSQTECYGNNSYFPTAILHARQIPGTQQVLAIAGGHHCPQMGKLILLDPARGRQENHGAQLVAPIRPTPAVKVDAYGQQGELWQYPYPLSATEFLVSYSPWGSARDPLLFGVYFMTIDGHRELLAHDPAVSCNQPVALRRPVPHRRPSATNYTRQTGTFYIQDVYAGPGLATVPRGTAKKLRVIGLDFRATVIGGNHNRGEAGQAFVATPVAVAQGSWEAKTILGETPIYADGSAFFVAPARMPIYFQVIDDQGHMIQTMRSWATLQPGENASCVGCHEHKGESPLAVSASEAVRRGPRPLDPFYGPPRGFSFAREIQPILDRHCTSCHKDRSRLPWLSGVPVQVVAATEQDPDIAFSLLSNTTTDSVAKRRFSDAYLMLTGAVRGYDRSWEGTSRPLVNWTSPQSGPPMREPYSAGSATSGLMTLLAEGHKGVNLSREDTEKLACWIDLVVPYCGDYLEANAWRPLERARYNYFLTKRKKMEAVEARNIRQLIASRDEQAAAAPADDEPLETTSLTAKVAASDGTVLLQRTTSAHPGSPVVLELARPLRAGDRIGIQGARHLAIQCAPHMSECLLHVPDGRLQWTLPAEIEQTLGSLSTFQSSQPQLGIGQGLSHRIVGGRIANPSLFSWTDCQSVLHPIRQVIALQRLTIRPAAATELSAYRNLAVNPYDLQETDTIFPHTSANSQWQNDPVCAARYAIDGQRGDHARGGWRCESSDAAKAEEIWWQIDFGRVVEIDKVVIVLRAEMPEDSYWRRVSLSFPRVTAGLWN